MQKRERERKALEQRQRLLTRREQSIEYVSRLREEGVSEFVKIRGVWIAKCVAKEKGCKNCPNFA